MKLFKNMLVGWSYKNNNPRISTEKGKLKISREKRLSKLNH